MAVRDRLDDVLQARSLPDDLVAPGHLPAKPLHQLIRHPDFPQKTARVKLGEDLRVDRIRFDLRMSDDAHGLGFAITTCLTCGAITAATVDALSVASSTTILLGELLCESLEKMTAHIDAPRRLSSSSSEAAASAKARWISSPMILMPAPPSRFVRSGSWRATRHLLIRPHGASGKVAKGGHVTSSGSKPTVYRLPGRTFVLPAPRMGSP